MTPIDRARIASAVARYDFWMDSRGVPRRARRGLRQELRANLTDATAHDGSRAAVLAIGSPKALAYAAGEAHEGRPRWSFGATVAAGVFLLLAYAWLFSLFGFSDGVLASGVTGREVSGDVFPWGSAMAARVAPDGSGFSIGGTFPWAVPAAAALALVLAAQPWRPLTHRPAATAHPRA